jgi:hypothetical protein
MVKGQINLTPWLLFLSENDDLRLELNLMVREYIMISKIIIRAAMNDFGRHMQNLLALAKVFYLT